MYCAGVIAHGAQLFGLGIGRIGRVVNGLCRPDADETICREESAERFLDLLRVPITSSSGDEPLSIGRDMAAVDFKILLLSAMREPYGTDVFHGSSLAASPCSACLAECL